MRLARWILGHQSLLLAAVGVLLAGYTITWQVVPWRFCHAAGVVIGLVVFTVLAAIELARLWWRDNHE